jgi:uncharacterized protein YukE
MDEQITAAEAASVLTRLVQDRKRLEKGAEIASALAGMEQATKEREAQLSNLDQQITKKQEVLDGLEETIRDKEFASTMHLQSIESDYSSKIGDAEIILKDLTHKIAQAKENYSLQELELTANHSLLVETYHNEAQDLSQHVENIKTELANLKRQAAVLSGV